MKFHYIKIDLESQTTYTCHAAKPHRVNFDWLAENPGNLFNHDVNVRERHMMLVNQRAPSCEQNCWRAEDLGQISPRLYQRGNIRSYQDPITQPQILDLTVGADCNLTCSYCCKEFSSSWRRELAEHGSYELSSQAGLRYKLNDHDRIAMKISQPDLMNSSRYNLLLEEVIRISPHLVRVDVTGGEPFLNNRIADLLEKLEINSEASINIYTGLGVEHSRLDRILDRLCANKQVRLKVSTEGIGKFLEFNRYGISWPLFQKNLELIQNKNMQFEFHSTLSNLTAFGFKEFYDYYSEHKIVLTFAYQPHMQAMHVLDPDSKLFLAECFSTIPDQYKNPLLKTMSPVPTELERNDMARFLEIFVKRRPNLDLNIYPSSFLEWLGIAHVV